MSFVGEIDAIEFNRDLEEEPANDCVALGDTLGCFIVSLSPLRQALIQS